MVRLDVAQRLLVFVVVGRASPEQTSRWLAAGDDALPLCPFALDGHLAPGALQRVPVFPRHYRVVAVQFTPKGADSDGALHGLSCAA